MSSTIPTPPKAPWAEPYWEAARRGQLRLQFCPDCQRHVFYPRLYCPHCAGAALEWVDACGRATLYSFTEVRSNAPSSFLDRMPFIIAIVDLEEGVRMMSGLVEYQPDAVQCGMPLELTFDPVSDELTLPKFRPARPAA